MEAYPDPSSSMATPTVVLLPVWGAGHLTPMLEAGRRLLACNSGDRALSLTVLVMPPPSEQQAAEVEAHIRHEEETLAGSDFNIRFLRLSAVDTPTDHQGPVEFISRVVHLHAPHVRAALAGLPCPVAAVLLDLFCTEMIDVARELDIPAYVYFTCNAAALSFFLRLPALCAEVDGEFANMDGAVDLPGLPPVPPSSLPAVVKDRTKPDCDWYAYHGKRFADADGIVVNTAAELEPRVLAAVCAGQCTPGIHTPTRIYPVGPVISFGKEPDAKHECERWLDAQPAASVVFLCFGSGGYFTAAQAHAAARGLERSGHRFLWVLRGPPAAANELRPTDGDLAELLPDGFLDRTRDRGLVWPTRAPQKEVLAHPAVGGFVTHCGWNSIIESLWFGVPMVTWPRYAEQHLNAFALVADVGAAVAMEVDWGRGNFVEAAELERAVREVMGGGEEGRRARERAVELMAVCRRAVEDGGSSAVTLKRLCDEIVNSRFAVVCRSS